MKKFTLTVRNTEFILSVVTVTARNASEAEQVFLYAHPNWNVLKIREN